MNKRDLEIGPCNTYAEYRGKNIYPFVLSEITKAIGSDDREFYIMTYANNIASQKGIIKAGFKKVGEGNKHNILGIFKILQYEKIA